MKRTLLSCAITSTLLLTGCGGSGGGNDTPEPPVQVTPPAPVANNTLTIEAVYIDQCNNETPISDAVAIVHGDNFSTKEKIQANSTGALVIKSANETETISVILPDPDTETTVRAIEVETDVDLPITGSRKAVYYTYQIGGCNCRVIPEVNFTSTSGLGSPDKLQLQGAYNYENVFFDSEGSRFRDVTVCQNSDGSWPALTYSEYYDQPEAAMAAVLKDYDPDSPELSANITVEGQKIDFNTNLGVTHEAFSSIDYNRLFTDRYTPGFDDHSAVFGFDFPELDEQFTVRANIRNIYEIDGLDTTRTTLGSTIASLASDEFIASYSPELLQFDHTEFAQMLRSENKAYNYSQAGEFDYLFVSSRFMSAENGEFIYWTYTAPAGSGVLPTPELVDLSDFVSNQQIADNLDHIRYYISLQDYLGIEDYAEFIANENERIDNKNITSERWRQRLTHSLSISILK